MDYKFYEMEYGGKAPSEEFPMLLIQAMSEVKYYTLNRSNYSDINVKYALCELIDYLYKLSQSDDKEIASESVGTYSVSYNTDKKDSVDKKKKKIIYKYLAHTGLLYRGV
ncbi:hypothetical protein [Senegalia massiliensis]|uniref:Uncharacterized protein n=1 Tax=Senegalia massiliensis TaxID=1720316 RepID=A0A845R021_9CLOT|nr:hypothetical protein [Senegalia massiliensis]NBI08065.1 hypothetical protein [Senegalia massiliensis]